MPKFPRGAAEIQIELISQLHCTSSPSWVVFQSLMSRQILGYLSRPTAKPNIQQIRRFLNDISFLRLHMRPLKKGPTYNIVCSNNPINQFEK